MTMMKGLEQQEKQEGKTHDHGAQKRISISIFTSIYTYHTYLYVYEHIYEQYIYIYVNTSLI